MIAGQVAAWNSGFTCGADPRAMNQSDNRRSWTSTAHTPAVSHTRLPKGTPRVRTCTSMAPADGHSLGIVLATSGAVSGAASGSGSRYCGGSGLGSSGLAAVG